MLQGYLLAHPAEIPEPISAEALTIIRNFARTQIQEVIL